jgi:hypothetical protein
MSQEWLKQLAELSNEKDKRKHAQRPKQAQSAVSRQAAAGGRSLFGAAFGHFFRWLFLFALAEAAAMFVVADNEGLTNEPWGVIFHYIVWYPLTQPIFPAEIYQGLRDSLGVTPADLSALYDRINPIIQEQQDALVFYVPAAAALALTLFFLPVINAGRRRSPIRFLVLLANLAVIFLFSQWRESVIGLWFAAFIFSFVGGGARRAPRQPQPQTQTQTASQQSRPAGQSQKAARPAPRAMPARVSVVERASRTATPLNKREPAVVRHGGGSWVRGR